MINLIAPETKRQLRAARINAILVNYCLMMLVTAGLLASIYGTGFLITSQERSKANILLKQGEQASASYASTKIAANNFKNDLKQAQTILTNQISMYDLLTRIASMVPSEVILSNLSLGTTSFNTPLSISAKAKTYDKGIKLKNNLAASNLFSSVSITNITTNVIDPKQDPIGAAYPVIVNLSAQFSSQFIKSGTPTGAKS
ncbi:MAG TPA: hypothetical protein VNX65_05230 [Patescibacteria group bacterium]|jgi:Tfp pilus assembly protein PilN|nr:hypothetical protein [Patescibacteria group bacterium]